MSKKPQATNASILDTLAIPSQVMDAIVAADAALAAGPKISDAIAKNAKDMETAKAEFEQAADAQAHAEAAMCLIDDVAEAKRMEDAAVAAGVLAEEKHRTLDRLQRVGNALKEKSSTVDLEVRQAREWLISETAALRENAVRAIAQEIADAAQPLLAVLAKAHALMRTLPHRDLGMALAEVRIPNVLDFQTPFVDGDRLIFDGVAKSLATTWRDDPAALAIFEALKPIAEANQRLGKHQPYQTSQKATGSGYITHGAGISSKKVASIQAHRPQGAGQELNMEAVFGGDLAA
ncbi:hypothetical protein SFMTTN_0219 [Sulfuriferula multivorans]|uniref:Uncharacterized protein n=1 Tax=Sulfuriferula multivorans TaxID=1559896 RepID=A0A401J9W4_9PROT|nr:hypothetical protein [Sulfuriferula multivorans]GBL44423.1 hypothetical protein SFMTTN_0219 [Sulfuriferula multivorans]